MIRGMSVACPCGQQIPIADINVAEGVALCRGCGKLSRLIDLATPQEEVAASEAANITPPIGCRIEDHGTEVTLVASTRSLTSGVFFLVFAIFWNSLVSVFVAGAIANLWAYFVGPVPPWFPAPKINGPTSNSSLGGLLFMCLFLTPFVLVGLGVAMAALFSLFGRHEVRLRDTQGTVFTGVGPIGWRRKFDASAVKAVKFVDSSVETNGKRGRLIAIECTSSVLRFGTALDDPRRVWLGGALKAVLTPAPGGQRGR
jgi:hypothetical protein